MIKSMTGYGKSECELTGKSLTIEIKALNSKQMDINTRIPYSFNPKEIELRNMIMRRLERGKIFLGINSETTGDESFHTINTSLAKVYYHQLKNLQQELKLNAENDWLYLLTRLPDVLKQENGDINESDWEVIEQALESALNQVDTFREHEGMELARDMEHRIHLIGGMLGEIAPFEKERMEGLKEKFRKNLNEFFENNTVDHNRFEQEMIFYLEKLDITEEKVRLKKHLGHFLETMHDETSQGKKLGFISQELGREINTIGSKANDANIQKIVVQMKDELEKIKEQLNNIL